MAALLDIRDLEVKYYTKEGTLSALRDVSFEVGEGEVVGIVGESGCGKSTLGSAVLRLLPNNGQVTAGQMIFRGRDLLALDEEEMRHLRGSQLSMIFQDPMTSLNPVFSVETQMVDALAAHSPRASRKELRRRAVGMLDRVGVPDASARIREYPHQFSGGMRQRIMIALALLSRPALMVADEPTSALDVTLEAQIIDLLRDLRRELGTAILYITHDLGVVAQLCDHVVVMYAGNIVEVGDVFQVFDSPRHPYTRALLRSHPSASRGAERLVTIPGRVPSLRDLPPGCKFAPRCDQARPACHTDEPQLARVDGRSVMCHEVGSVHPVGQAETPAPTDAIVGADVPVRPVSVTMRPVSQAPAIVQAVNLSTHFRDRAGFVGQLLGQKTGVVRAVDSVDLAIARGETVALVGESGSGKTTLGRTILRLQDPTGGQITLEGRDITRQSQRNLRPMRGRMQMIFQDPVSSLSPRLKVSALLNEPFRIHGVGVNERAKVGELLEMVGLAEELAEKYPHQLSGGQARRVGIARALALNPDLLVADEPTSGLDVSVAAGILNLMKDLRERLGLSYLIITHNLEVVSFIADRVGVMYLGKVVELATAPEVFTAPKHPYSEALISAISLPDPHRRDDGRRIVLQGEIPSSRNPPPGCAFHPRCRYAEALCVREAPGLYPVNGGGRLSACHFPERVRT